MYQYMFEILLNQDILKMTFLSDGSVFDVLKFVLDQHGLVEIMEEQSFDIFLNVLEQNPESQHNQQI